MSDILKFCGAMIIAAILYILLKNINGKLAVVIPTAAVVISSFFILSPLSQIVGFVKTASSNADPSLSPILVKICAVSLIGEGTSRICSEASETLVKCVSFASRTAVIIIVFPLFKSLVSTAVGLIP